MHLLVQAPLRREAVRCAAGRGQVHVFGQGFVAKCLLSPKNGPVPNRMAEFSASPSPQYGL